MQQKVLQIANKYTEGLDNVRARRDQWLTKHKEVKDQLKEIADFLNSHSTYRQGFFIDTLHAFSEDNNGTCADMPSLSFRTGDMPMLVAFRNSMGERKEYLEHGFHISFNPTLTGQIVILLNPHYSDLSENMPAPVTLAVFAEPSGITRDIVDQIIEKGMEMAFYSSFTGMSEIPVASEQPENPAPQHHYPIGFRRYETTEKVK